MISVDISIRQLVEVMDIDSPIYFTEKDKLNRENYFYFQPMGEAEVEAIRNQNHNPQCDYDPAGIGLHLPDITATEYLELENSRNPVGIESNINLISQQMIAFIVEYPILLATFSVLHEYGHWVHYINSGKSSYEYALMETNERKPYEKIAREIKALDDWDPHKIILGRRYHNEIYSQFTSEKFANKYAMEHFAEAIEKVRAVIGYTEQDLLEMPIYE